MWNWIRIAESMTDYVDDLLHLILNIQSGIHTHNTDYPINVQYPRMQDRQIVTFIIFVLWKDIKSLVF